AFVFTAGIGENSPTIRTRIVEKLAWLGAIFDPAANAERKLIISRPESRVALLVVPTDEELMIAQHTLTLLPKHASAGAVNDRQADGVVAFSAPQRANGAGVTKKEQGR